MDSAERLITSFRFLTRKALCSQISLLCHFYLFHKSLSHVDISKYRPVEKIKQEKGGFFLSGRLVSGV
jgi:hypothetical protein